MTVTADAKRVVLPLTINVYGVDLPKPGQVSGSLLTTFGVGPQAYVGRAIQLFGLKTPDQIRAANDSLFAFLSSYRIGPDSWGYGIPKASGYVASSAWWKDSAGNMASQLQAGQFATLWIPLSTNRATPGSYIAGLSPNEPEKWCGYLQTIRRYWESHGWLQSGAIPYAYPYDEPGDTHTSLLARQATTLHRCFPGARMLTTATPGSSTKRLWDGKGTDDVDIWAAVDWRYYGVYTSPAKEKFGNRAHRYIKDIAQARRERQEDLRLHLQRGARVPVLQRHRAALEPAHVRPLDGARGHRRDPLRPGPDHLRGPRRPALARRTTGGASRCSSTRATARRSRARAWSRSARASRTGRSSTSSADVSGRRRCGRSSARTGSSARMRRASSSRAWSAATSRARLPQAWPAWSHDWSTAGRVEAARLDALKLASS